MLRLNDLNNAVDDVHSYFDQWGDDRRTHSDTLREARLAAHEWTANLVQHAEFQDRCPSIALTLRRSEGGIWCVITDNSDGFNLEQELERAVGESNFESLPERGMGLLMLHACASEISYSDTERGRHRLAFRVTSCGEV